MKIIESFVKPRIQDNIESILTSSDFPYFFNKESCVPCGYKENEAEDSRLTGDVFLDSNTIEAPQFIHTFVSDGVVNSGVYKDIAPILNKVLDIVDGDYYVAKCKVNMNLIDTRFEGKYHTPHIDNGFDDQITAIYYVNDSDGDTLFFDDSGKVTQRVTPKKGTLVMWKGKVFHAKSSPIKTTSRVVININLLPY
jgi:predicted nucleic-acid-binding Zn-ribbon protein